MRSVVCLMPDEAELILSGRQLDSFFLDPDTYYHFREKVFIERITDYIKMKHPREFTPGKAVSRIYPKRSGGTLLPHPDDSPGEKMDKWFERQGVIYRYYQEWRRQEPRFYTYQGQVYSFLLHGFGNIGNEIELIHWEPEDLEMLLNDAYRHPVKWLFRVLLHKK